MKIGAEEVVRVEVVVEEAKQWIDESAPKRGLSDDRVEGTALCDRRRQSSYESLARFARMRALYFETTALLRQ